MLKIKLNKAFSIWIGLVIYFTFLVTSYFFEISTFLKLRSPYLNDPPYNNLIPFRTILTYISDFNHYNTSTLIYNILGNLLILLPIGLFLPLLFNIVNQYRHILFIALPVSVTIEVLQYITLFGVFDIDDIILKLSGSFFGFYVYLKLNRKKQKR